MKYSIEFLKQAHKASIFNKSKILNTNSCACFCCKEILSTTEIKEFIEEIDGKDETATCPSCGIDSIIDDIFPINDPIFLEEMSKYWFE
ncbi:cytoplasmic protein [Empedobacter falsenii]